MTNRLPALLFLLLLALPCPAAGPPDLDQATTDELAAALTHTNAPFRAAAARRLVERNDPRTEEALRPLVSSMSFRGFDDAKGEALWILHRIGKLPPELLAEAIATDGKPLLQTNALRLASEAAASAGATNPAIVSAAVLKRVRDVNPRVRLAALEALVAFPVTGQARQTILDLYPEFTEPAAASAAIAIAAKAPAGFIADAASAPHAAALTNLVSRLAAALDAPAAAQAVITLAASPDEADPLKRAALEAFVKNPELGAPAADPPLWSDDLAAAFKTLFERPSLVSSPALALAARWDKSDALAGDAKKLTASLIEKVKEDFRPDETRAQFVTSLLAARRFDTNVLPTVSGLLDRAASPRLKRKIIAALGATADPAAGAVLMQFLLRADWKLAARAAEVLDSLRRPVEKEKNALLENAVPAKGDQPDK